MIVFGALVVRRYDLLARMLASVERGSVCPDRYVVVDNGANPDAVRGAIVGRTDLVEPGKNLGVSAGFNTLLDACQGDDLLVVSNDDIEFGEGVLRVMVDALESADLVLCPGFIFHGYRVSTVLDRVGYWDEQFFPAYYEDCDYHRRAKLAGIRINSTPPTDYREAKDFTGVPSGVILKHEGSASLKSLTERQQRVFSGRFIALAKYYYRKWGGEPGKETFSRPFDGDLPPGWQERPITVGGVVPDEPWLRA